ncbi:MAG: hypothetical protein JWO05_582 [Gemmatimonadetes bacterium]|nr:hypothetical protein [Gemmatimonadota bacterium]
MSAYLLDDPRAQQFEPFALTRPAGELRAGVVLTRERWHVVLGVPVAASLCAPHLDGFEEPDAAAVITGGEIAAGSLLVNARALPALQRAMVADARAWRIADRIAAVRVNAAVPVASLVRGAVSFEALAVGAQPVELPGHWAAEVWDYVRLLPEMLASDIMALGAAMKPVRPEGCLIIGMHPVFVEQGAVIEPHACFDVSAGPVLVRAGAHVHAFTRVVGPCSIGRGAQVTTDRVAASSIGDRCKVHGEMSNTIMLGHCNKGHDGFVGHSYLGRWVNLGAGTITSNLKNTYGPVALWTPGGVRDSGMQFLGTLFGDHAKTGIGTTLNTGTVLGAGANVFGGAMPGKAVRPFAWGDGEGASTWRQDKFLEVAERVMARRDVALSDGARRQLEAAYARGTTGALADAWHVTRGDG